MPSSQRVAVVIPTYNCAKYLVGAVESALQQTHVPAEVIIVDDGSRDDTQSMAAALAALSPTVQYLRQPNAGVSAARNLGMDHSQSEFIALLDADDRWHSRKLELQLRAFALNPQISWSLTGCEVIDGNDRVLAGDPFVGTFSVFRQTGQTPEQYFSSWLKAGETWDAGDRAIPTYTGDLFEALFLGNVCLPSSAVMRREILHAGGFDARLRLAEETEFFHRLAAKHPLAYLAGPLVRYRQGGEGSLTAKSNTVALATNALESMRTAAAYRGGLTDSERATYARGRTGLLLYLARAQIAESDTVGAQRTLRLLRQEANPPRAKLLFLSVAAAVPSAALRAVQATRRAIAR